MAKARPARHLLRAGLETQAEYDTRSKWADDARESGLVLAGMPQQLCVGRQISWVPEEKVAEYAEITENIPHRGVEGWRQITHRCMAQVTRHCEACNAPVCGKAQCHHPS